MADKRTDTEASEIEATDTAAAAENIVTPTTGYQHDTGAFRP